jgi:16S rRNA (uracil1498-N3)-methyltransferase
VEVFYQPDILSGTHELSVEESRHCIKVLRHEKGDTINVADGRGTLFQVRIEDANPKKCTFHLLGHSRSPERHFNITVAIAPTKRIERIEWFVEKVVELGIDEINFYFSQHSERKKLNMERIQKKAIVAMKQSEQYVLPRINLYDNFGDCLKATDTESQKYIAHVDRNQIHHLMDVADKNMKYTIFIGPEGDFSEKELIQSFEAGFTKVSLGENRLRTETAGLAACHILTLINR